MLRHDLGALAAQPASWGNRSWCGVSRVRVRVHVRVRVRMRMRVRVHAGACAGACRDSGTRGLTPGFLETMRG